MAAQQVTKNHASGKYYERFNVAQRIEHFVLILTFSTLAITGLPQKFVGNALAEGVIALMGGIEAVRIIHRIAAIGLAIQSLYHVLLLGYKVWVRRTEMTMLPGLKDVTDAIDVVRYNLGLTKEHPKMPRYNFGEKVEYWAMVWGTVIMAITGFMLWNPIAAARFLPGQAIPAAKAAHGAEALLAVLAILIWHFYNVHLKMFNKSMFNGKMTHHQMVEEHGAELDRRVAGLARPAPNPEGVRHRERIYVPVAVVLGLALAGGLFWFATFEETAIATLPPQATQVPVFSPLAPTPEPTSASQLTAALIPHPVEGQEQCDTCHGINGMSPFPTDHVGRPNESCTICHLPGPTPEPGAAAEGGATAGGPGAIPANHDLTSDTYKDCATCHGTDKMKPYPANHEAFPQDNCTACHKPAEEAGGATEAEAGEAEETAGGPGAIPANHDLTSDTYKDCATCHGTDKMKPYPANHEAFPQDNCTACHQPSAGATAAPAAASGPAGVPHSVTLEAFADCANCHGVAGAPHPYPDNHASYTAETCTGCHPAPEDDAAITVGAPNQVPHSMTQEIYTDCKICHAPDVEFGVRAPDFHAGYDYTATSCTACHAASEE